jgi:DNA-binding XRE family transcriptional regulator
VPAEARTDQPGSGERDDHPWSHPEGPGQGGRIRAARAAADLNREELGVAIGSTARTIRRLEDEQRRVSTVELRRIAAACHVPEWFLLHGWRGWERLTDR